MATALNRMCSIPLQLNPFLSRTTVPVHNNRILLLSSSFSSSSSSASSSSSFTTSNFLSSSFPSSSSLASTTPSSFYRIPLRSYMAQPRPSLSIQDVQNLAKLRTRKNDTQRIKIGAPLTVSEIPVLAHAKTYGYLQFASGCTATVCNTYYRFCWSLQRPYMAINPHGTTLIMDLRSIYGLRNIQLPSNAAFRTLIEQSFTTYTQGINAVLAQNPGGLPVQISSDQSLNDQINRTLGGANEGTNYFKQSITSITPEQKNTVFILHTQGKAHARAVAEALYKAYTGIFNLLTPQQILLQKQDRKLTKLQKYRSLRIRQVRKLVSSEDNLRHLYTPKGVVDGFIRADRAGQIKFK